MEQVGNAIGSDDWKASGKKEHAEGEAELKAAKAKGCKFLLNALSLHLALF